MGYFDEHVEYDANGNITRLRRGGLTDNLHGGFGLVDDLYMTYTGNMLTSVRDDATHAAYAAATDFHTESRKKSYPLTYNGAGSLVSDAGRNIAKIDYDRLNNLIRIQFTNGNVTRYVYSATGEKLRTVYLTAVPNISVAIGSSRELAPSEIQYADSTDYLLGGALTLKNGRIDKYQFGEGYCQAARRNATQDSFTFLYYDRDHLGNIRQVTKDDGTQSGKVVQRMDYYPFGAQLCDGTTDGDYQPRRYSGKEFDRMHGLNTYDYGARQYNPVTARWDRVDPLCEKYYSISPYAYCANNPVNAIDPDGRALETVWDIANIGMDVLSFARNVIRGNFGSAAVDFGATVVDAVASFVPFVPGGVGTALKAHRASKTAREAESTLHATKNNYRRVLQKTTEKTGEGYEANHTLPQKWREKFEELGINIDKPGNVVWRDTKNHRKNNNILTKEWNRIMRKTPTKEQVMKKRDELENKFFGNKGGDVPNN